MGAARLEAQSVEAILRASEDLALTEQQVQQLDQIRREAVAQRSAELAQLAELRSQLAAGQIRRSEVMALMEDQQEAREARAEERRASLQTILTEEQLDSAQQLRRRADRGGADRARPGRGPGGRQGFAPGFEGFGPDGRRGVGLGGPGAPPDLDAPSDDVIGLR